jgi:DNA-binding NtrC family response regulator
MKKAFHILIVDDEADMRDSLRELLNREGYQVSEAANGLLALQKIRENSIDLIISDILMPEMDGLTLLKKVKETDSDAAVILITGYSSIQGAIEAIKFGAEDYFTKPFNVIEIKKTVERIYNSKNLIRKNEMFKQEILRKEFPGIIGRSDAIHNVLEHIKNVADSNVSVLITGESGVGKELVAQAIHKSSLRNKEPFIPINCAAVPKDLLESEFFGHEKGSFSGAINRKYGIFEIAHKGTLFLDEIGEMPYELQAKLLRTVETKQLRRIGGSEIIEVDIRILCSTNRDLKQDINDKKFREDLYFRLATYTILVPPLRERRNDIPLLINNFLKKKGILDLKINENLINLMMSYDWPGNVRELENVLERLLIISKGKMIELKHLPQEILKAEKSKDSGLRTADDNRIKPLEEIEKEHIMNTFNYLEENKVKTAHSLGIGLKTLYRKLEKYQKEN